MVIVAYEQALHVEFLFQHQLHKLARGEHRHGVVEVQHGTSG